jgi:hypothetical protein
MAITFTQRSGIPAPTPEAGAQFFMSCIEKPQNMIMGLGSPVVERRIFVTEKGHVNRIYASDISGSASYGDGHFNGQTARIYIIEAGCYKLWRTSTVTASKMCPISNAVSPQGTMITGTSYEDAMASWYRPGASIWYAVRSVDSANQAGPRSDWVEYVLPDPSITGSSSGEVANVTIGEGGSLAAPTNFTVSAKAGTSGETVVLSWDPVAGASGYQVEILWQDPSLCVEEEYLELGEGTGPFVPEGALVLLEGRRLTPPTTITARVWFVVDEYLYTGPVPDFKAAKQVEGTASEFVAYSAADPAPSGIDAGHYMRRGLSPYISFPLHAGTGQSFYPTLVPGRTYRVQFLLRGHSAMSLDMGMEGVSVGLSDRYEVSTDWDWYGTDISVNSFDTGTRPRFLTLSGAAGTLDIAAAEFYDLDLDRDDLASELKPLVSAGTYLRDHRQIKPGVKTNAMEDLTSSTGFNHRYYSTVYSHLRHCQINDLKPWLQIEWFYSAEEWRDFVAYMAAPVSSGHPMALKRRAQGQESPWTVVFPDIMFEIGNEAWQPAGSAFWGVPFGVRDQVTGTTVTRGVLFGLICDDVALQMQISPYYEDLRKCMHFFVGGHINSTFGAEAVGKFHESDYGSTVGYTGAGWDVGGSLAAETGFAFSDLLATPWDNDAKIQVRIAEMSAIGKRFGVYEDGPSGFIDGLSADQVISQEVVQKSRAMATADLDELSNRLRHGCEISNFFRLQSGNFWASHAPISQGGGVYGAYAFRKLIHDYTGHAHVRKLSTEQSPTRPDGKDAIAAYMYISAADPSKRVIVASNRNINPSLLDSEDPDYNASPSGTEPITIHTGLSACTGLQYYANVGNFREHNRYPEGQRLTSSGGYEPDPLCVVFTYEWSAGSAPANPASITINADVGAHAAGLPAGNCVLLKLEGCT